MLPQHIAVQFHHIILFWPVIRMSKCDESSVTMLVSRHLGLKFRGQHFDLGDWSKVDDYAKIAHNRYLFLEVESRQNIPIQTS